MAIKRSTVIGIVVLILITGAIALVLHDLMFSTPDHRTGTVIEKMFVPSYKTGASAAGGTRKGYRFAAAQEEEQWIALVRLENGDTLKVHCHPDHYKAKNVGDVIHFKKYEGKLLHIEYFAHNEEED